MNALEENIINLYGEEGKQWLLHLPKLITTLKEQYKLTHLKTLNNLSYNYVLAGFQDSNPIVLKLGLDKDSLKRESEALKAFSGFGGVALIAEEEGMLLLEQAIPGKSLCFIEQDDEAVAIAGQCIKRLHQSPIPFSHQLPHITDWLLALDANSNIPNHHLQKARTLRKELLKTSTSTVLLHGDLHHANILQQGNDWLVIDPKGVLGESAYEVGAFIRNPIPELLTNPHAHVLIKNRISHFSKILKIPKQRIIDWSYVQAVLSWVWTLEDKGDETYFKKLVELFHEIY